MSSNSRKRAPPTAPPTIVPRLPSGRGARVGEVMRARCLLPDTVAEMSAVRRRTGVVGGMVVVEGGSNGGKEGGGQEEGMDRQRKVDNVNASYISISLTVI